MVLVRQAHLMQNAYTALVLLGCFNWAWRDCAWLALFKYMHLYKNNLTAWLWLGCLKMKMMFQAAFNPPRSVRSRCAQWATPYFHRAQINRLKLVEHQADVQAFVFEHQNFGRHAVGHHLAAD